MCSSLAYALVALFVFIVVTTTPKLRAKHHNGFELVHRFGGWLSLALLWALTLVQVGHSGAPLLATQEFWVLCAVTAAIIAPWTAAAPGAGGHHPAVVACGDRPVHARPQAVRRLVDRDQPFAAARVAFVREHPFAEPSTASG